MGSRMPKGKSFEICQKCKRPLEYRSIKQGRRLCQGAHCLLTGTKFGIRGSQVVRVKTKYNGFRLCTKCTDTLWRWLGGEMPGKEEA